MPRDATSPLCVIACEPPSLTAAEARDIVAERYGLRVEVTSLLSERDQNFRLDCDDGKKYVLKIANAAEDPVVTDFQIQALLHIAARAPEVRVPEVLPTRNGENQFRLEVGDASHTVRVVSYLSGARLETARLSATLCRNLGAGLADLGLALRGFEHPGSSQNLLWDMQRAPALRELLVHIDDRKRHRLVAASIDDFETHALPQFPSLRAQVVHNDLNPANVLVDEAEPDQLAGIIDFGDMLRAPLAVDIAIAASYLRALQGEPLTWVAEFVAGYHGVNPLSLPEVDVLYDLINTRLAATVAILHWRAAERGQDDDYLAASTADEADAVLYLERLRELPRNYVRDVLRQVCASVTEL